MRPDASRTRRGLSLKFAASASAPRASAGGAISTKQNACLCCVVNKASCLFLQRLLLLLRAPPRLVSARTTWPSAASRAWRPSSRRDTPRLRIVSGARIKFAAGSGARAHGRRWKRAREQAQENPAGATLTSSAHVHGPRSRLARVQFRHSHKVR